MHSVCQHKVRAERKTRKGVFTSLGKMNKWEPRGGNFVGDNTRVEEGGQTQEEKNVRGRSPGLEEGHCLTAVEQPRWNKVNDTLGDG